MLKKILYVLCIIIGCAIWVPVIRDLFKLISTASIDLHPVPVWQLILGGLFVLTVTCLIGLLPKK